MSRTQIMLTYVLIDLLIVGAVLWAAFVARWPVRQFFIPAALLFVLNGAWLIWMTIKHTPPGS
ncbi:MAG TPA: hypothetical protein VHN74_18270, partial [Candidatus Angelobacter sp.]|nr:hypothetical protein [Candidatus Angelobacter sp.]